MTTDTWFSPQERVLAFLDESDRRLADEAPPAPIDWRQRALTIAAMAEEGAGMNSPDDFGG